MVRNVLIPLVALTLAALLLYQALDRETAAAEEEEAPMDMVWAVTAAPVEARTIEQTIDLVGELAATRRALLAFERSGTARSVEVELGDRALVGQVLAELDDTVLLEELATAQAAAEAARAEAEFARRDAERTSSLSVRELSDSERDRLSSQAAAAEKRQAQQEAAVRRLQAMLGQGTLAAPFDGVILERAITAGTYVQAGTTCFELLDLGHREMRLEIPAKAMVQAQVGAPVRLRVDEIPGTDWQAELSAVLPAADPASRIFTGVVRLDEQGVDPEGRLLPGMFVRAQLTLRSFEAEATVPSNALLHGDDGTILYEVVRRENGTPRAGLVPVRVLADDGAHAAVLSLVPGALAAGDEVVVTGAGKLFPDAPLAVQPHDAGAGAAPPAEVGS